MAGSRERIKGRKTSYSFVQLRHDIMRHENFRTMSAYGKALIIDLLSQFNGRNNGDFCAAWGLMKDRGWRSKSTLQRAKSELLKRGWVTITRQGGKHCATLYAVTWLPIDECDGKLDVKPTTIALNLWKEPDKINFPAPNVYHISTPTVPIPTETSLNTG